MMFHIIADCTFRFNLYSSRIKNTSERYTSFGKFWSHKIPANGINIYNEPLKINWTDLFWAEVMHMHEYLIAGLL